MKVRWESQASKSATLVPEGFFMGRTKLRLAALLCTCAAYAAAAGSPAQPMSLTVSPISFDHKIALSQALAQMGIRVRDGYVLFGIDIRTTPEPQVDLKITDPTPLGVALAQVVGQVRGYGYQPISEHLIDVYSTQESMDPTDILNLRVTDFMAKNEPAANIFSRPKKFIPELNTYLLKGKTVQACGSIGPGLSSTGPGVTLNLHGATVREILDSVAEADATLVDHAISHDLPVGWFHKVETNAEGQTVHTWSFLSTVPRDWGKYVPLKPNL
jgi:hypothetical protein